MQSIPRDRDDMFHPSMFQSQAKWEVAQNGQRPPNPVTVQHIREFLEINSAGCLSNTLNHETSTVLYIAFMGTNNREILHNGIKRGVFEESGNITGRQDDQALYGEMQKVYDAHARNMQEDSMTWDELKTRVIDEVKRLNCIVYSTVIPTIVANVQHYLRYRQEMTRPLPLAPTPQITGLKDTTLTASNK